MLLLKSRLLSRREQSNESPLSVQSAKKRNLKKIRRETPEKISHLRREFRQVAIRSSLASPVRRALRRPSAFHPLHRRLCPQQVHGRHPLHLRPLTRHRRPHRLAL